MFKTLKSYKDSWKANFSPSTWAFISFATSVVTAPIITEVTKQAVELGKKTYNKYKK